MRYECKYCGKNMTSLVLMQLEGKITKEEVKNYCEINGCKRQKQENNY